MIPKHKYLIGNNLEQVLTLLNEFEDSKLIAGGTDIIPGFHIDSVRFKNIKYLIDISRIKDLKSIERHDGYLSIGAAVTFNKIVDDSNIQKYFPLLISAASTVGSHQIRNRATIGGNFINNAPCADSVPALLVYDAVIEIRSLTTTKEISLAEFLLNPYQTAINKNELVTKIKIPLLDKDYIGKFYKLGRRRGVAISRISLAIMMKLSDHNIEDVRIASGAVTPIGIRFSEIESMMKSETANSELFKEASREIGKHILELTGLRWSSLYKLPVVQQKIYQLLEEVYTRAQIEKS
jgi:CO/xanthine dehydrogenase FAD-binding subunit